MLFKRVEVVVGEVVFCVVVRIVICGLGEANEEYCGVVVICRDLCCDLSWFAICYPGEMGGPGEGDEEYCGVLCCGLYCDLWFVTLVKRERPMRSLVVICVVICHDLRFVVLW